MHTAKTPPKPLYHVEIGGKERPVRFGMNAIALYNEATNTTLADFQATLQAPPEVVAAVRKAQEEGRESDVTWMPPFSTRELIALVWAGLKDGARKEKLEFSADGQPVTLEDVGDWIDEAGPGVIETVFEALMGAQPAEAADATGGKGAEGKAQGKAKKGKK